MKAGSRAFSILNGCFAALFLLGAAIQFNDPDPLRWAALYAAAAVACVLVWRLESSVPSLIVGVVALTWAATMAPRVLPVLEIGNLARKMEDKTPQIEQSREMLGLLIIAAWMAVLALRAYKRSRST